MPFAKRGDVVHSEAASGFNNQKKSLLINGLAALGDSHHPLHSSSLGRLVPDTESSRTRKVILPAAGVPHYPGMTLLADR